MTSQGPHLSQLSANQKRQYRNPRMNNYEALESTSMGGMSGVYSPAPNQFMQSNESPI